MKKHLSLTLFALLTSTVFAGPEKLVGLYETRETYPTTDGMTSIRLFNFTPNGSGPNYILIEEPKSDWESLTFPGVNQGPKPVSDTSFEDNVLSTIHYSSNDPTRIFRKGTLALNADGTVSFEEFFSHTFRIEVPRIKTTLYPVTDPELVFACWSKRTTTLPNGEVYAQVVSPFGVSSKKGPGARALRFWERESLPGIVIEATKTAADKVTWQLSDAYTGKVIRTFTGFTSSYAPENTVHLGEGLARVTVKIWCEDLE